MCITVGPMKSCERARGGGGRARAKVYSDDCNTILPPCTKGYTLAKATRFSGLTAPCFSQRDSYSDFAVWEALAT